MEKERAEMLRRVAAAAKLYAWYPAEDGALYARIIPALDRWDRTLRRHRERALFDEVSADRIYTELRMAYLGPPCVGDPERVREYFIRTRDEVFEAHLTRKAEAIALRLYLGIEL